MTPLEFLAHVEALCQEALEQQSQINRALSLADKAVSDIYHQIELNRFNAAEGYLLARQLKAALQHRRDVKWELYRMAAIFPMVQAMQTRHREAMGRLAKCEAKQAQFAAANA